MVFKDLKDELHSPLPTNIEINDIEELLNAAQVEREPESQDPRDNWHDDLLSSDLILTTEWPEPKWAVPNLLPAGLSILGGAPKVGKSFLGMQMTLAVVSGGVFLDRKVEAGPALYFALEDPPRRLQERMRKQGWVQGLPADFLTLGSFEERIGDLRTGGAERIARQIERKGYRLVVIDTFSRALLGDQNDVREMTAWMSPLQEIAHNCSCAVLLIDHHRKNGGFENNVVADIMGSTAKGAMVDTALGLYKERGENTAELAISGREVPEKTIHLVMDWETGFWAEDDDDRLTWQQKETIHTLNDLGPSSTTELAIAIYGDKGKRGIVFNHLKSLCRKGYVIKNGHSYAISNGESL